MIASTRAIQSAARTLRARSQRPVRLVPCSIAAFVPSALLTRSTYHAGAAVQTRRPGRRRRAAASSATAWSGKRPYAVGPAPLTSARKAPSASSSPATGEEARSFGGRANPGQRVAQGLPPLRVAGRAVASVERAVDRRGRGLRIRLVQREHDRVVLRQVERGELGAVPTPELRAGAEEEGHVRAECRREPLELAVRERVGQGRVREAECGRGVGAAAAEACGDGDPLLDPRAPARLR